jgi:hypothetical protein
MGILSNHKFDFEYLEHDAEDIDRLASMALRVGVAQYEKTLRFRAGPAQKTEAVKKFESKI